MNLTEKLPLFLLRIALGWMFFWSGITKVLDPKWSAESYIKSAKYLPQVYHFFLQPNILPWVNLINEWGLVLLGASLILGILVRFSAPLGVVLMLLYYLALSFPHPNPNAYIVDEHVVYIFALICIAVYDTKNDFSLGSVWR